MRPRGRRDLGLTATGAEEGGDSVTCVFNNGYKAVVLFGPAGAHGRKVSTGSTKLAKRAPEPLPDEVYNQALAEVESGNSRLWQKATNGAPARCCCRMPLRDALTRAQCLKRPMRWRCRRAWCGLA